MDEIREKKASIRNDAIKQIEALGQENKAEKTRKIEERLFEFANFLESTVCLLYMGQGCEVPSGDIVKRAFNQKKIIVLPAFNLKNFTMNLMKVDDLDNDLIKGPRGVMEPDPEKCKKVPIDKVDIAIIPGYAFDEKGGRIGSGMGFYDRLIPKLPITTRKVSLVFEELVIPMVPMESHDKYVDIIITDKRIIYKI